MVGQAFDLLVEPGRVEPLDLGDSAAMKFASTPVEQAGICDLVGQGMLEGVLEIRKQAGLVDELGGLQALEPATERRIR